MAAVTTPTLSPEASNPNEIDFHQLRLYIEEHFANLPDSMTKLSHNLESHAVCRHLEQNQICPPFFTNHECTAICHPEFILKNDGITWMPRKWICRALQRHAADGHGQFNYPTDQCPYSHAGKISQSALNLQLFPEKRPQPVLPRVNATFMLGSSLWGRK